MPIDATFSWYGNDPDGDNITYRVFMGKATPSIKTGWSSSTTYQPYSNYLEPGESYSWKIEAKDSKGLITVGPVWHFVVSENNSTSTPTPTPAGTTPSSTRTPTTTPSSTKTPVPTPTPVSTTTIKPTPTQSSNGTSEITPTPTAMFEPTPTPTPAPIATPPFDIHIESLAYKVNQDGLITEDINIDIKDGLISFTIPANSSASDINGKVLNRIIVIPVDTPTPTPGGNIIGFTYNFLPEGAQFNPPGKLTLRYDPDTLPDNVMEQNLVIGYFDEDQDKWIELDSTVNTTAHTITAYITHFTEFGILNNSSSNGIPNTDTTSHGAGVPWVLIGGLVGACVLMGFAFGLFIMYNQRRLAAKATSIEGSEELIELEPRSFTPHHRILISWSPLKSFSAILSHFSRFYSRLVLLLKAFVAILRSILKKPVESNIVSPDTTDQVIVSPVKDTVPTSEPIEEISEKGPSILVKSRASISRFIGSTAAGFRKLLNYPLIAIQRIRLWIKVRFSTIKIKRETQVKQVDLSHYVTTPYESDAIASSDESPVLSTPTRVPILNIRDFRIRTTQRFVSLVSRIYHAPSAAFRSALLTTNKHVSTVKSKSQTQEKADVLQDSHIPETDDVIIQQGRQHKPMISSEQRQARHRKTRQERRRELKKRHRKQIR